MNRDAASSSPHEAVAAPTEHVTSSPRTGRRARSNRRAANTRHRRLRMVYFALASAWGFAAGSAAVLAGFKVLGNPVDLGAGLGVTLAVAGVVAIIGGIIVSLAYREAVKRGF